MYFVHPQIKLNRKNLKAIPQWFLNNPKTRALQDKLNFCFPNKKIIFTDMGRTAFQIIIEKLNLRNSAMLFPAYTCDIFYPILKKYNISPVFIDADLETFNIDIKNLYKKISPTVNSILIPHIYGLANDMEKIKSFAKTYNLKIIEDCAHSFIVPCKLSSKLEIENACLGNFGNAALFSLYKIFPCFRGGMLVCPKDWDVNLSETYFSPRDFISFLNCFPVCSFMFKKFGRNIAPKMIRKEKSLNLGQINKVSLNIFSYFLDDYKKNLNKRIKLGLLFQKELKNLGFETQKSKNNTFCYVSALIPEKLKNKRNILIKKLRKYKIFCTKMWHTAIILNPMAQKTYNINLEEFPQTIEIAQRIINFPLQNYYTEKDIKKIIDKLSLIIDY